METDELLFEKQSLLVSPFVCELVSEITNGRVRRLLHLDSRSSGPCDKSFCLLQRRIVSQRDLFDIRHRHPGFGR